MATLQEIGVNGLVGLSPTPIMKYAVNKYFVNNEFLAVQKFVPIGMGTNVGNFQANAVVYDGSDLYASNRGVGEEYTAGAVEPKYETFTLKMIGGSIPTDVQIERALSNGTNGMSNYLAQQLGQKVNQIANTFAKQSILGDVNVNGKQFDGINKFLSKHPGQVIATAFDSSGGMTHDTALKVERHFNNIIALMDRTPNVCYTTRSGKTYANTINGYRNRGVEAIEVNGVKYNQLLGIPLIELSDDCFSQADLAKGMPFIFAHNSDDEFGVRYAIPNDNSLFTSKLPEYKDGKLTGTASVEIMCVPLLVNPFSVAKGFVTETGNLVPITAITVTGETTLDIVADVAGEIYTAALTPSTSSVKEVTWAVDYSKSVGNVELANATDLTVVVKPKVLGKVTLVATAADGTGVKGELEITVVDNG